MADNFRGDWQMLWKEITVGFLLAGFVAQLGNGVLPRLFVTPRPAPLPTLENVVVGPLIAVLSFVCSVGNVPLAAVLWSGGIGFAGVLAFLFADLIVLPIIAHLPQVLRRRVRAADHRADVRDHGASRRCSWTGCSACWGGPHRTAPTARGHLRLGRVDYKLVLNVIGAGDLRRPVRA